MIDAATGELEVLVGQRAACRLTGKSRATLHRHRNPKPPVQGPRRPAVHPAALTAAEQAAVLTELRSERFVDKSPAQVWAILLDEGRYLCSVSTMYRLLRGHGEVAERRRQATHPARTKPELVATGPNQVWSWDTTKLAGPGKGIYYVLLVMLDIFSRKAIRWRVVPRESQWIAKQFQLDAIAANDGVVPDYIHADNGGPMISKPVSELLIDLNITRSHSRPHVSNDNPYSEANFKTLKYCPAFPDRFASIREAQRFCEAFFTYYNNHHRHSGIGLHTPATVHDGTAHQIRAERATVLSAAYAANPGRFRRPPTPPKLPSAAWINEPAKENINTEFVA
ncbi:transposase [Nocardia sp. CA-084685]|uniref:transposase n=1 Tax=Nocardia sp. CA-084685 TaxID=3239970 RepID=UPI003D962141